MVNEIPKAGLLSMINLVRKSQFMENHASDVRNLQGRSFPVSAFMYRGCFHPDYSYEKRNCINVLSG